MPPNDYICDVLMVRALALLGYSLFLLDDPHIFILKAVFSNVMRHLHEQVLYTKLALVCFIKALA